MLLTAGEEVTSLIATDVLPSILANADASVRVRRLYALEDIAASSPLGTLLPVLLTSLTCFESSTWLADVVLPRMIRLCAGVYKENAWCAAVPCTAVPFLRRRA
jgi:hypothetical protein